MKTIRFNRKFLGVVAICCFCFILEYVVLSLVFTKNDVKIIVDDNTKRTKDLVFVLDSDNILGDTFVRDFYRYNCKSVTRYGSSHSDPMYRIDG